VNALTMPERGSDRVPHVSSFFGQKSKTFSNNLVRPAAVFFRLLLQFALTNSGTNGGPLA